MPCYYPLLAVQHAPGAVLRLFGREQAHLRTGMPGKHLEVPCGQCSGCRRRRSLEWAMRCTHEAQTHERNCYITLTYDDNNIPEGRTLVHRDWQLFMKRLRKALSRGTLLAQGSAAKEPPGTPADMGLRPMPQVRFYMAGEYGEIHGRPHYHAILFGIDFNDKTLHGRTKAGEMIYRSATLEKLWPHGYSSIGNMTFASAAYIARYVMKKRTGDKNKINYEILDLETGEIVIRKKEYNCMSRAEGIGKTWWDQYKHDVLTGDYVVTKTGMKLRPPRYYDKQLKRYDQALYEHTKHARELEALAQAEHHTPERLAIQEIVANAKASTQTRNLE